MNTTSRNFRFHAMRMGFPVAIQGLGISSKAYAVTQAITSGFASVITLIKLWHTRASDRQHIANMSPRILQDIGMDSVQARIEANKPFWKE